MMKPTLAGLGSNRGFVIVLCNYMAQQCFFLMVGARQIFTCLGDIVTGESKRRIEDLVLKSTQKDVLVVNFVRLSGTC